MTRTEKVTIDMDPDHSPRPPIINTTNRLKHRFLLVMEGDVQRLVNSLALFQVRSKAVYTGTSVYLETDATADQLQAVMLESDGDILDLDDYDTPWYIPSLVASHSTSKKLPQFSEGMTPDPH